MGCGVVERYLEMAQPTKKKFAAILVFLVPMAAQWRSSVLPPIIPKTK